METDTEYDNDIAFAYNSIAGAGLTIAKMVDQLEDVIVNAYDRTWFDDYKSNWIKRIHRYFNANNIAYGKSKATWDIIASKVIEKLCCNNYDFKGKKGATESALFESTTASSSTFSICQVPVSPPKISENCSSAVLLSSAPPSKLDCGSGSTDVIKLLPLTSVDKSNIVAKYANLDVNKMWKLSTGTIVEEKMRERALKQTHEHLSHSLILNINDNDWLNYFTEVELAEVRNHHSVELPPVPVEVEAYLSELRGLCPRDLYTKVSSEELALNSDVKWVQDAFSQSIRLVQSGFFPVNNITEGGLVKRVWGCLDTCFDFSRITCISGEKCSQSSADAMNANRSSVLCRQKSGRKMDYLFLDKKNELGCGECGLDNGVNTTKELSDANFKMPKVMRDMLVKLVSQSPALKRDLVISGFYIGETKLKMVVLDSPCGYVTRYDAMEDVLYPEDENELYRKLSAVLRIILGAKTLMETTAYKLTNDTTNIQVGRCKFEYMVPSFIPNNINKKRKH